MGIFLDAFDLQPFASIDAAKADAMIGDAEAMAVLVAPCITAVGFTKLLVVTDDICRAPA